MVGSPTALSQGGLEGSRTSRITRGDVLGWLGWIPKHQRPPWPQGESGQRSKFKLVDITRYESGKRHHTSVVLTFNAFSGHWKSKMVKISGNFMIYKALCDIALAGFYSLPVDNSFWLSALIKAASFCFLKYIRFLPDWWLSRLRTAPPAKYLTEWKSLSRVSLFATPWPIQSMEFSRPEYWSGLPFPFFRGSSQPRVRTQVSCIAGDSLQLSHKGSPRIQHPSLLIFWVGNGTPLQYSALQNSTDCMGSQRVRHYWATFTFTTYLLSFFFLPCQIRWVHQTGQSRGTNFYSLFKYQWRIFLWRAR